MTVAVTISHFYMTSTLPARYRKIPYGQIRALRALIAHDIPSGRTYKEAAEAAEMSLGTLYTHLRRVRQNHPEVYGEVMETRSMQLAVRHHHAVADRQLRSREWWYNVNKAEFYAMGGWNRRLTNDEKYMMVFRKELARRQKEGLSTKGVAEWAQWNS